MKKLSKDPDEIVGGQANLGGQKLYGQIFIQIFLYIFNDIQHFPGFSCVFQGGIFLTQLKEGGGNFTGQPRALQRSAQQVRIFAGEESLINARDPLRFGWADRNREINFF